MYEADVHPLNAFHMYPIFIGWITVPLNATIGWHASYAATGSIPERWQPGYVFSLGAQPDGGKLLAACCSDGSVRAWAHEGGGLTALTGLRLHNAMGSAAAWHADGRRIAATFSDGSISVLASTHFAPFRLSHPWVCLS
jgi:WD40 repeat protein